MKNEQFAKNSISESLLNKNIYYVLLTSHENTANLRGDIANMRKSFYENGRKTVKINEDTNLKGVTGKVTGKLSRHNFIWKKEEAKVTTEECFKNHGVYTLAIRDLNGSIRSKIFYNKNMLWIKTEYYSINDFVNAELIFKPVVSENAIERFAYDPVKKNYFSTLLYPTEYKFSSAEESMLGSKLSEDMLLVSMESGEYLYCTKENMENRAKLKEELKENASLLTSVWSKNIEIEAEETEPEEQPHEENEEAVNEIIPEINVKVDVNVDVNEESVSESENIEESAKEESLLVSDDHTETIKEEVTPFEEKPDIRRGKIEVPETDNGDKLIYTGTLIEGKRNGRGRTDRKSGLTAFDGEYLDNKRNGFGCSYYKNGNLSYAGFWKDDKKDGMGVSFRNTDHAVQVTSWKEGKPESHTTIFDSEGYLKYTGKIIDGVKNGLCLTYDKEDGTLFAGKWMQSGEAGCGSLFDSEGNLIYSGCLKDGKRNGQGTEFDKNGEIVFTGIWKDDEYSSGTLYKKI